jgi:hypothetical protein
LPYRTAGMPAISSLIFSITAPSCFLYDSTSNSQTQTEKN